MSDTVFSFRLSDEFVNKYNNVPSPFGFQDAGSNSLGEITFIRTYSRVKEDGTKERWHEVCRRVIEGMYSVQKNHAKDNRLPWNDNKAQKSAQEAFQRMFELKWTPPGRGLWAFGTPMTMEKRNSASLQNCAMVSTRDIDRNDPGALFAWVMDALMLGIGVGFDTLGQEKQLHIYAPTEPASVYEIPDTREGWVESVRLLINSFLRQNQPIQEFSYDLIRPLGAPIKGFGGVASGPAPLIDLHTRIRNVVGSRAGEILDSRAIVDIVNLIGTCVVSGNVRRSATLALGVAEDKDFINLKNPEAFPERNSYDPEKPGWAWMSNNSIAAEVGTKYEDYVDLIADNGEPGFIWLDVARNYGRLADAPDYKDSRIMGFNPCAEQPLESYELCTLVEVHLNRHESKEDFLKTLKFAYLYGKTVTLMPTHWQQTNGIMQRNRRIGTSLTGIAAFADEHGSSNNS
jgi:ribonucleoside-triphosphate reductase (thioredoxin)